jgi:hypothetical protein
MEKSKTRSNQHLVRPILKDHYISLFKRGEFPEHENIKISKKEGVITSKELLGSIDKRLKHINIVSRYNIDLFTFLTSELILITIVYLIPNSTKLIPRILFDYIPIIILVVGILFTWLVNHILKNLEFG